MQIQPKDRIKSFKVKDQHGQLRTITHKRQEPTFDDPASCMMFQPTETKPLVMTRAAIEAFGERIAVHCLLRLQEFAEKHGGIDYLQTFKISESKELLWLIDDGEGGAITALLPTDY